MLQYLSRLLPVSPKESPGTRPARVKQSKTANSQGISPTQAEDELERLRRSTSEMAQTIQTLQAALEHEVDKRQQVESEAQAINLTLEQRVLDRTRELSVLYEVSAVASQSPDLETLLTGSLERIMAAIHCEVGAIYLLDETTEKPRLRLAIQRGMSTDLLSYLELLPADTGLAGWVIMQAKPLLVPHLAVASPTSRGTLRPPEPMTCMVAPMRASGQVIGIFGLLREPGRTFRVEEVALLASVADQVGGAVENEHLRQLSKQADILAERQRMSRDLHDSVTQSLYSLSLLAELGQAQLNDHILPAAQQTFMRISETTRQALKEMRLFIHQLRPPALEQEGLVGVLHQRLAAVEGRADMQARLLADEIPALPSPVAEAFYHIAQEALNNTLNHARATSVIVYLRLIGEQLVMEVVDNGGGFDTKGLNKGRLGLISMRERAEQLGAHLQIASIPGAGTKVKVSLNLEFMKTR